MEPCFQFRYEFQAVAHCGYECWGLTSPASRCAGTWSCFSPLPLKLRLLVELALSSGKVFDLLAGEFMTILSVSKEGFSVVLRMILKL